MKQKVKARMKLALFAVFAILVFGNCNTVVRAAWPLVDRGACSDKASWELRGTKELGYSLIIKGSGDIGEGDWYPYKKDIDEVIISDNITGITDYAFCGMPKLESIQLPSKLDLIGENAFASSGLKEIEIPDGVTYIGESAFEGCSSLEQVDFPESVDLICENAFAGCSSLSKVRIPSVYVQFGENTFGGCKKILSAGPIGSGADYEFGFKDYLPWYVFEGFGYLEKIELPNSIKEIGGEAFCGCRNLKSIRLPNQLVSIRRNAFHNCIGLESITLPDSVKVVEDFAFCGCDNLTRIIGGKGLTDFGFDAYGFNYRQVTFECYPNTYLEDFLLFDCRDYIYYTPSTHVHKLYKVIPRKEATCDEKGVVEYYECSCKNRFSDPECKNIIVNMYMFENYDGVIPVSNSHSFQTTITKATTTTNGRKTKACIYCGKTETTTIYKASSISLSDTSFLYDGKEKKPTVTVKDSQGKVVPTSNYSVSYSSGRINVGTYNVKVTFKNDYSGTAVNTYSIIPAPTKISGISSLAKGLNVIWAKQTVQTTGYDIQYSVNSSFANANRIVIGDNNTRSMKILSLRAHTRYYVRVRTFKSTSSGKVYSKWSQGCSAVTLN